MNQNRVNSPLRVLLMISYIFLFILVLLSGEYANDAFQSQFLYWVQMVFSFTVPSLIIYSSFAMTSASPDSLSWPTVYNKIKRLFIPYLIIALFYCIIFSMNGNIGLLELMREVIILGNWEGYFVLIIIAGYLLSFIMSKLRIYHWLGTKSFMLASLLISGGYFYLIENITFVKSVTAAIYPLNFSTIIFGWLGYYAIGTYIGKHLEAVKGFVRENMTFILAMLFATFALYAYWATSNNLGLVRSDFAMIPYAISGFALMLSAAVKIENNRNKLINVLSPYAFYTCLMVPIFLPIIYNFTSRFAESSIIFVATTEALMILLGFGVGIIINQVPLLACASNKPSH